ncbi:type II toxin-antitoxin system HicB family antitoxin [bacterium]|nr:type II toxin-antitoxin system HicB family antitoxin [bacterium]
MTNYRFTVLIEHDEDGWIATVPELQGCFTQGDTYEELLANVQDVLKGHVELYLERGEPVPQPGTLTVTSVEVAV